MNILNREDRSERGEKDGIQIKHENTKLIGGDGLRFELSDTYYNPDSSPLFLSNKHFGHDQNNSHGFTRDMFGSSSNSDAYNELNNE